MLTSLLKSFGELFRRDRPFGAYEYRGPIYKYWGAWEIPEDWPELNAANFDTVDFSSYRGFARWLERSLKEVDRAFQSARDSLQRPGNRSLRELVCDARNCLHLDLFDFAEVATPRKVPIVASDLDYLVMVCRWRLQTIEDVIENGAVLGLLTDDVDDLGKPQITQFKAGRVGWSYVWGRPHLREAIIAAASPVFFQFTPIGVERRQWEAFVDQFTSGEFGKREAIGARFNQSKFDELRGTVAEIWAAIRVMATLECLPAPEPQIGDQPSEFRHAFDLLDDFAKRLSARNTPPATTAPVESVHPPAVDPTALPVRDEATTAVPETTQVDEPAAAPLRENLAIRILNRTAQFGDGDPVRAKPNTLKLLKFMATRDSASFDNILESVWGSDEREKALETEMSRVNKLLGELQHPLRLSRRPQRGYLSWVDAFSTTTTRSAPGFVS